MLNKKEFIEKIAAENNLTKDNAERITNIVTEGIINSCVENGGVQFVGKFSISVAKREERAGYSPRTREVITIPASKFLKIKTGSAVKALLNE